MRRNNPQRINDKVELIHETNLRHRIITDNEGLEGLSIDEVMNSTYLGSDFKVAAYQYLVSKKRSNKWWWQ